MTDETVSRKRELRFIYCRTTPWPSGFLARKTTWRFYKHPGAIGLYVWIREAQHHFRIEKV